MQLTIDYGVNIINKVLDMYVCPGVAYSENNLLEKNVISIYV